MSQPAPTPVASPGSLRAFAGAAAVVTGGASGLGCALAKALAVRGADVVLADRQVDLAREVAAAIVASGGRATAVELDVTDPAAVERVVRETRARCGRLDRKRAR